MVEQNNTLKEENGEIKTPCSLESKPKEEFKTLCLDCETKFIKDKWLFTHCPNCKGKRLIDFTAQEIINNSQILEEDKTDLLTTNLIKGKYKRSAKR